MKKKLRKDQAERHKEHADALADVHAELEAAVSAYNAAVTSAHADLLAVVEKYNVTVADAREFAEEVQGEIRFAFEGASEKWQESDAGQALESWAEAWSEAESIEDFYVEPAAEEYEAPPNPQEVFDGLPLEVPG